jgi:hypothetical protein
MRRLVACALGVGLVGAAPACTSLLGDFSSGPAEGGPDGSIASEGGPSADGAGQDASSDGATPTDAPLDVDAAPPTFTCNTFKWAQPLVLEDLTSQPSEQFVNVVAAFQLGNGVLRVVGQKSGGVGFSVYTVTKATQAVVQLDAVTTGGNPLPLSLDRSRGQTANITSVALRTGAPPNLSYEAYAFPDTMDAGGPLPAPFDLYEPPSTTTYDELSLVPFTLTDVFEAYASASGSPADYTLAVGRVAPTNDPTSLSTVATSVSADSFTSRRLYRANGNVYLYDVNDPLTPGISSWVVPETATLSTPPPTQTVASGLVADMIDIAPNSMGAAADVLTTEETKNGSLTESWALRIGVVPMANLTTWTTADLTQVRKYTMLGNAPLPVGHPYFFGEDIMLLGSGFCILPSDGGACSRSPGLNMIWLNAVTGIRSEEVGVNALMPTESGFDVAFAVPASTSTVTPSWDIVWVQTIANADGGGTHEVLYMNELECQ